MTQLFLYETIHVNRGTPRLLGEHVAALDAASQELFGREYKPHIRQLTERIAALIHTERYPVGVSGFVRLELTAQGERLVAAGASLYEGYALRALMPDAATVEYNLPTLAVRSSAHEAATELANLYAQAKGAPLAIRCDREGLLIEADNAPLFAVKGRSLLATSESQTVVGRVAIKAATTAGLNVVQTTRSREELAHYDELFYADHRGITALAHCNGHPYTSLTAERVARAMERLFG